METTRKVQDRTRSIADLRAEVEALQNAQSAPVATVEEIAAGFAAMSALMGWSPADVKRMAEASHKKLSDAREKGNAARIAELESIIGIKEIPDSFGSYVRGLFKLPTWATIKSKIPASKGKFVVFTTVINVDTNEIVKNTVSFPRGEDSPAVVTN